jgi:predicted transcriptional regulator
MSDPGEHVKDLIFGRWRSQILYAGVELGVFEAVGDDPLSITEIADQLGIDETLGYRLLRALASIGLLTEAEDRRFALTEEGELLQADHPQSMRGVALLEEGPTHYKIWKHLPDLVREGEQNAFDREFGHSGFEHQEVDSDYARVFNDAMTSFSLKETELTLDALDGYDFSSISRLCDIGGGHGHLLATLLKEHAHLRGALLEQPGVLEEEDKLWPPKLDVDDRCTCVAGDMFDSVPEADGYMMKHILHDWNDEECRAILETVHDAAEPDASLFIMEHIVPGPDTPHFAKLFDVHMMVWGSGRERTAEEYAGLLEDTGWSFVDTRHTEEGPLGVVEGVKA